MLPEVKADVRALFSCFSIFLPIFNNLFCQSTLQRNYLCTQVTFKCSPSGKQLKAARLDCILLICNGRKVISLLLGQAEPPVLFLTPGHDPGGGVVSKLLLMWKFLENRVKCLL